MRLRRLAALAALSLALTACGSGGGSGANALRIMAPAAPGGGWDQTSRIAEQAFRSVDQSRKVEVYNVPGAGGSIGLAQLAGEKGNGDLLMTMGLVMVGRCRDEQVEGRRWPTPLPIAKLTEEYEIVVVPADSPYKTLADLVDGVEGRPGEASPSRAARPAAPTTSWPGLMAKAARHRPEDGQLHRLLRRRRGAQRAAGRQGGGGDLRHRRVRRAGEVRQAARPGRELAGPRSASRRTPPP